MNPHPPNPTVRHGFTLVELLVAISVLSLMILLANRVFLDTRRMVSRGLQTSQIIAQERALSDPLLKDARAIRFAETGDGASPPGFLVIVQDAIVPTSATVGVKFPPTEGRAGSPEDWEVPDRNDDGTFDFQDAMRSDQLAFFRDASNLDSVTPGELSTPDSKAKARTARVWYGHVSPLVPTTGGSPLPSGGGSLNPGETGNELATELTLGRQVLLLVEDEPSTLFPNGDPGSGPSPARPGGARYAVDAPTVDGALFDGTTDVFSLSNGWDGAAGTPATLYTDGGGIPTAGSAMFSTPGWQDPSTLTPAAQHSTMERLLNQNNAGPNSSLSPATGTAAAPESWDGEARMPTPAYAAAALEWAFARNNRRLQAGNSLEEGFGSGILTSNDLSRVHASFVPHIADFTVEFAADFEDDLDFDATTGLYTPGTDGLPDNEPDRDGTGAIKWYTGLRPNPDLSPVDGVGDNFANEPVTYLAPTDIDEFDGNVGSTFSNPYLHVIPNGATGTFAGFGSPTLGSNRVVFVFGHSGDDTRTDELNHPTGENVIEGSGKHWPYLLRIRYRLLDGRGDYRSADPNTGEPLVGRWFEQIVPVPRPAGLF